MIVYVARNRNNGKVYVGKTVRDLSHAKARHHQRAKFIWKYGVFSRFYTAIRKHGFDAFEWEVVYKGRSDPEIQEKERELIAYLKATDKAFGYNMTPGGDGGAGKKLTAEHIGKLREAFSKSGNPQYGKFGASHPAFGRSHSEEAKAKIGAAHKGVPKSPEARKKISETRTAMFAGQVAARKEREAAERADKIRLREEKKSAGGFKGENARASKLTNAQRKEICERRNGGESYASIANDYPLGLTGVREVCKTWGAENGFGFSRIVAKRKTKLDDAQKAKVCEAYLAGESMANLAKTYEVSETTIHTIIRKWAPDNGFDL